jgi:hypothetical protein
MNNIDDPLTKNDYYQDPDIFISKLSGFIAGLNNQRITGNYLERSKKEFKHLFNFLSGNGVYLITKLENNNQKSNKIYRLLEQLSILDSKRYPDEVDNIQATMRKNALVSKNRKGRKSRKLSKAH